MSYNNHLNPQLQAVLTCFSVTAAPTEAEGFHERNLELCDPVTFHGEGGCVLSFQRRFPVFAGVTTQHDSSFALFGVGLSSWLL